MTNAQTNPFFSQHEEGNTFCSCNECLPFEMPKHVATDWDSEWTSLDVKLADDMPTQWTDELIFSLKDASSCVKHKEFHDPIAGCNTCYNEDK